MYQFPNQQLYHYNAYQQCPTFADHTKHPIPPSIENNQFQHNYLLSVAATEPNNTQKLTELPKQGPKLEKVQKKTSNKSNVDTSSFSIEERLVAAVWVHERKRTKVSISQIKHDFKQRFGRDPPAKNTLLVWERKLFATGSVCDAPRPGRPVRRGARVEEVAASVRVAPALSLRARARALRLPRSTLRAILRTDLPPDPSPAAHRTGTARPRAKVKLTRAKKPPHSQSHPGPAVNMPPVACGYAPTHHIMHPHTTYT